jgi:hypothetical protein
MGIVPILLDEDYWEKFELQDEDIEFLYNNLLENETPLTSSEIIAALIQERIRRQKLAIEQQRSSGGDLYQPKGIYTIHQRLVFPALNWRRGQVLAVRPGENPDLGEFQIIQVALEDGDTREFATNLTNHILNEPPKMTEDISSFEPQDIIDDYGEELI